MKSTSCASTRGCQRELRGEGGEEEAKGERRDPYEGEGGGAQQLAKGGREVVKRKVEYDGARLGSRCVGAFFLVEALGKEM